jgi:hypothetical protein
MLLAGDMGAKMGRELKRGRRSRSIERGPRVKSCLGDACHLMPARGGVNIIEPLGGAARQVAQRVARDLTA